MYIVTVFTKIFHKKEKQKIFEIDYILNNAPLSPEFPLVTMNSPALLINDSWGKVRENKFEMLGVCYSTIYVLVIYDASYYIILVMQYASRRLNYKRF